VIPLEVRTERLLLRQWREEDVEPLAEIYSQPHYLELHAPLDLDETKAQVRLFTLGWRHEGFSLWAAEELQSGQFIGRIGLMRHHDWPLAPDPVEVGWALDADHVGRGLATEGGHAAVACWRDHLHDEQLISITLPANRRSRAVMERLGLTYRGEADWRGHRQVWYAIDR
jgi:RimJ/RimL family protein N-acetyltransferase